MSDAARQHVLGRATPAHDVATRDFRRPRRLGQERLRALQLALKNGLPALEKRLLETAGLRLSLALGGIEEVDVEAVLASTREPLCALRFRCGETPAWCLWDPAAAAGVVESMLGSKGGAASARALSRTEVRLVLQPLGELARGVASALGQTAGGFALVQAATELGSWRDAGAAAESYRLEVRLDVRLGEQASRLRFYLPGVPDEAAQELALPETLPAHLERVEIELSACLPGCEISLEQLLALEEGDVIPLDARLGDPATLSVEGLTLARARLGSHGGRLALRIEQLSIAREAA